MTVIIFGGGIAGLTVAHELLECGYKVQLYEGSDTVGGFARSRRLENANEMPTEVSARAYGPYYSNFFNIAKRIPVAKGNTVYDNLSTPLGFLMPHDKITKRGIDPSAYVTFGDYAVVGYPILKTLMSNQRRAEYAKVNFKKLVQGKLSKAGTDESLKFLGPLGTNPDYTSLYHVAKFVELSMEPDSHVHRTPTSTYLHHPGDPWHVMKKPTSEAWFDPWLVYLKRLGLKIHFNSRLTKINTVHKLCKAKFRVGSCAIKDQSGQHIIGTPNDIYVFAINPFIFKGILTNSGLENATPEFTKSVNLVKNGPDIQFGFQLALNKKIRLPKSHTYFVFPDSEFGIILYFQDGIFDLDDPYFKSTSPSNADTNRDDRTALISGTAAVAYKPGKIYGKPAKNLTKEELIKEITYQIFRSKEFKNLVEKNNNYKYKDLRLLNGNIWHEWNFTGKMQSIYPKWVNSTDTYQYRPNQKSGIPNAYIGGAHTNTSTNHWLMEGAIESGKIIAKDIIDSSSPKKKCSVYVKKHGPLWYLVPFQFIDDILYNLYLPNVLDFILIIILILVVLMMYRFSVKGVGY